MNVLLNLEEAHALLVRMTGSVLDGVELSAEAQAAIKEWRTHRAPGTKELDDFTIELNEALGNYIDERTQRRLRLRGGLYVSETEGR